MRTWKLDTDGELSTENGNPAITTDKAGYIKEKLTTKLRLILGEWFLNPNTGIFYFEEIYKKAPDINLINQEFRRQILAINYVSEILELTTDFNADTRILTITIKVKSENDDIIIEEVTI